MSKKISVGVSLALILASIAATFAITMAFSQSIYNKLISNISGRAEMYAAVDDINALIRNNYYFFASINNESINQSIANGYIEGLNDPNSKLLTAEEYADYTNRINGKASGIGITTAWDAQAKKLVVTSVANGSSAAAKGIKKDDIILKISGERVHAQNYEQLLAALGGDTLSTISVTCLRKDTELEFNVTVGYSYVSVTRKSIGSVGYVRITDFYANTQEQLKEAVGALQDSGAQAIVFDLRGTSNGTIEYAAAAIDCITPICSNQDEVLVELVGREGNSILSYPSTSNDVNLPMAVLVDENTAGPAELFACDLRDFGKAVLVGVKTAGVGTAQQAFTLEDGSAVILTTSKVIPYKKTPFHDVGLSPDYEVVMESVDSPELLDPADDAQLQKAISVLSK
ncbi:MAG: PDZ domain-containing protein [Clostridia bacterium]|nr:PDZ domain-containing protein [Clostridia bacterium]